VDYFLPASISALISNPYDQNVIKGKEAYLKKLTSNVKMRSVEVGKELYGSTPPSVFIGSWNYPKVFAGPMVAPLHGDTTIMDCPESWIPGQKTQDEIIGYRMSLVRGKRAIGIWDLENRLVTKLQEISMSANSVDSQAKFDHAPRGQSFSDEHSPFGPSAIIEKFDIDTPKWDNALEKVFYDGDLKASEALRDLHRKGVSFSQIQKAFSVGTMGRDRWRKLVPTRWSITACDSTIGKSLLQDVRQYDMIDCYRVHEFSSLNNYYSILLLPMAWQYEWMEAFLHILGKEELIFSDFEHNVGKNGYSTVGGCYYSCKMAVLEGLAREQKQAGVIVFREAYPGYVPMGVFNVRENVRNAMQKEPKEFADMKAALSYISTRLWLPLARFMKESTILKELRTSRQTTLGSFSMLNGD
jgi:DNA repair protein NreA